MQTSIIIAYHNEGQAFINETVKQIRATADLKDYEILIVDDHSKGKISVPGARIVRHAQNHGVGRAFDTGAYYAKGDNLIIMGSDIRFIANNWMSKLVATTDANPHSLICTNCVALNKASDKNMDIAYRRNINMRGGASLLFKYGGTPKKGKMSPRSILAAQWLPDNKSETGVIEVPVILGAIYGVKRDWYMYIDGFAGHHIWGTLEPLISIKSYKFGGNCLCNRDIDTGHIFCKKSLHNISQQTVYYNKIWAASILFDKPLSDSLIAHLPASPSVQAAKKMVDSNRVAIKRKEYKNKAVLSDRELLKRMKVKQV